MTVFAVMIAGLFPFIHLGRVWLVFYMLPVPNQRTLWPNFQSPLIFDVVAISPMQGGAASVALNQSKATRNAQKVLRSLTDMGLPASRVSLSASSSGQAVTSEVHIYVR